MKKIAIFVLLFYNGLSDDIRCQSVIPQIRGILNARENDPQIYDCNNGRMTLDESLDHFIYKTFNKVVIGDDEVIKNGTALNLSVTDKTKLSGNYVFKLADWMALSFGLNAAVTNSETAIVNNKGVVQSGWGLSTKLSILPGRNWGRFDSDSCNKFFFARREFINNQLNKYSSILAVNINQLQTLITQDSSQLIADSTLISALTFSPPNAGYSYLKQRRYLDSLQKVRQDYYKVSAYTPTQFVDSVFNVSIKEFESVNAPWNGYRIWWVDLDMSLNTFNKTTIYNESQTSSIKISENEIFWKYKIGPSLNYADVGNRHSFYTSLLLSLQNAYKLEGKSPIDTFNYGEIKVASAEKNSSVYDISQLPDYKKQKWIFAPSILINSFHGKYKMLGWEVFYETLFRNGLDGVEDTRKVVMNARVGFIVNFSERYKTSLPTIGVFLKSDEYNFKDTFKDYLSVGLRVGVPFDRIFNKKS